MFYLSREVKNSFGCHYFITILFTELIYLLKRKLVKSFYIFINVKAYGFQQHKTYIQKSLYEKVQQINLYAL
jgi:hypothetical protein